MTVIPNGFAAVTLRINTPRDDDATITFGVENDTGIDTIAAVTVGVADAVAAGFSATSGIMAGVSDQYTLRDQNVLYRDGLGLLFSQDFTHTIVGASTAEPESPQTAALIRKSTALAGVRFRGRMYMPGYTESGLQSDGTFTSAVVAANQTRWSDFLADLTTENVPMVLLHSDSTKSATPAPTTVLGLTFEVTAATQRRRIR